jgi:hypothetical protein
MPRGPVWCGDYVYSREVFRKVWFDTESAAALRSSASLARRDEAVREFREALRLQPVFPAAEANLAKASR